MDKPINQEINTKLNYIKNQNEDLFKKFNQNQDCLETINSKLNRQCYGKIK